MDDRQIIEAFLNRRDDAVKHLFEKYFSYCFKIAWNILFNKEDSDECVNDTGLRTWESIPPNEPDSLRAYVGRITRNLAITRVENSTARKRGGGQLSLCLDELSECVSGGDDTLDIADRMTLGKCLNEFLAGLKKDERIFFVQRYWYMMSVSEIANQNGCTQSKVKMSLKRRRDELRSRLISEGIEV